MKTFESQTIDLMHQVEKQIATIHQQIDSRIDANQWRVLQAFQKHQVSDFHFSGSTGYGYHDRGREVLDLVYADIFGAEAALVRPHFVSGTHTISVGLFATLRPGDELLYITGKPYDTLAKVIQDQRISSGSLAAWGISYQEVNLSEDGEVDYHAVRNAISSKTKVIGIQRSRGYSWRSSFSIEAIAEMVKFVKSIQPDLIVFVDNCYGEFTELEEPTQIGADLIAGSLIKNPGGGIAQIGGYLAGKKKIIDQCAYRLTTPGLGSEVGAMLTTPRSYFQGLFLAPHFVGQALKGAVFASAIFEALGFETSPRWDESRTDLIQAIRFQHANHLISFVQAIQQASPVDSHVTPVPWDMPGYENPVIMAAGTFIQGGSLELSADAPIREPYIAYVQGGLTYSHCKYGILHATDRMRQLGMIKYSDT